MKVTYSIWARVAACFLAFVLIAASCGDDDDDAATTGDTPTTAEETPIEDDSPAPDASSDDDSESSDSDSDAEAEPTSDEPDVEAPVETCDLSGEPIVLGLAAPVVSDVVQVPAIPTAAKAAAESINNRLCGINGRPIVVEHCDDKGDPNEAVICARELVDEKAVIAMVGIASPQSGAYYPVYEAGGIANVGPVPASLEDLTHPQSFPLLPGALFENAGSAALVPPGSKVVTVWGDSAVLRLAANLFVQSAEAAGVTDHEEIFIPVGTVDYAATAQQVADFDPDYIGHGSEFGLIDALNTIGLGDVPLLAGVGSFEPHFVDAYNRNDNPILVGSGFELDPSLPGRAQYLEDMAEYAPDVSSLGSGAFNAWLSVVTLAQIFADNPETIDRQALLTYLQQANAVETGVTPPIDFTSPGPIEQFPRIVNTCVYPGEFDKETQSFVGRSGGPSSGFQDCGN